MVLVYWCCYISNIRFILLWDLITCSLDGESFRNLFKKCIYLEMALKMFEGYSSHCCNNNDWVLFKK